MLKQSIDLLPSHRLQTDTKTRVRGEFLRLYQQGYCNNQSRHFPIYFHQAPVGLVCKGTDQISLVKLKEMSALTRAGPQSTILNKMDYADMEKSHGY